MRCFLFKTTREVDEAQEYMGWNAFIGEFKAFQDAKKYAQKLVNGKGWINGFQLVEVPQGPHKVFPHIREIGTTQYDVETDKYFVVWELQEHEPQWLVP